MAELVPAIHVFLLRGGQDVDARDKPGHDEVTWNLCDFAGVLASPRAVPRGGLFEFSSSIRR